MTRTVQYGYARINAVSLKGVTVESFNQELLSWLDAEVKRRFPDCDIQSYPYHDKEICYAHIFRKFSGQDLAVGWWILSILCQNGWQPFYRSDNLVADSMGISFPRILVIDLKMEIVSER